MIEYEVLKRQSKKNLKDENYLDLLNEENDSEDLLHLKRISGRERETILRIYKQRKNDEVSVYHNDQYYEEFFLYVFCLADFVFNIF